MVLTQRHRQAIVLVSILSKSLEGIHGYQGITLVELNTEQFITEQERR